MLLETRIAGYADHFTAFIAASYVKTAQLRLGIVLRWVHGWMRGYTFSKAISRTEILVLTNKRIQSFIQMRV